MTHTTARGRTARGDDATRLLQLNGSDKNGRRHEEATNAEDFDAARCLDYFEAQHRNSTDEEAVATRLKSNVVELED
ncbi:hypothetical protein ABTD78_21800, partial [Acinetobacter baumannii]